MTPPPSASEAAGTSAPTAVAPAALNTTASTATTATTAPPVGVRSSIIELGSLVDGAAESLLRARVSEPPPPPLPPAAAATPQQQHPPPHATVSTASSVSFAAATAAAAAADDPETVYRRMQAELRARQKERGEEPTAPPQRHPRRRVVQAPLPPAPLSPSSAPAPLASPLRLRGSGDEGEQRRLLLQVADRDRVAKSLEAAMGYMRQQLLAKDQELAERDAALRAARSEAGRLRCDVADRDACIQRLQRSAASGETVGRLAGETLRHLEAAARSVADLRAVGGGGGGGGAGSPRRQEQLRRSLSPWRQQQLLQQQQPSPPPLNLNVAVQLHSRSAEAAAAVAAQAEEDDLLGRLPVASRGLHAFLH